MHISSNLFNVCSKDDIYDHWIGLTLLNETSQEFELPNILDPLSNAFKGGYVLEESITLWWSEDELDDLLLATCNSALRHVALKVFVLCLKI